jgi:hypothetical protein
MDTARAVRVGEIENLESSSSGEAVFRELNAGMAEEWEALRQKLNAEFATMRDRHVGGVAEDVMVSLYRWGWVKFFAPGVGVANDTAKAVSERYLRFVNEGLLQCNEQASELVALFDCAIETAGARSFCTARYAMSVTRNHAWVYVFAKHQAGGCVQREIWRYDTWRKEGPWLEEASMEGE